MAATQTVFVTGGSRGLGLAMVCALAEAGYRVVAIARTERPELSAAIAGAGGAIVFSACDLSRIEALPAYMRGLHESFGVPYALINNAGVGTGGVLSSMPDGRIVETLAMNLTAPILITKYAVRRMMARGEGGRILMIGSIVGATGYSGLAVYSATKAALAGFARSLAREVGSLGITVNTIAPGFIDTDMTREISPDQQAQIGRRSALRRMAEPCDVAAAAVFLLSEGARNITGTVLTVDAGNTT